MANNYTEATMTPPVFLTPQQRAVLPCYGARSAPWQKEKPGSELHYVYWESTFIEDPDEDDFGVIDAREAGFSGKISSLPYFLRDILLNQENEGLVITVEGCHRCDKMRPGEFGGFALMVTRKEYAWVNTGMLRTGKGGKIVPEPIKVLAF